MWIVAPELFWGTAFQEAQYWLEVVLSGPIWKGSDFPLWQVLWLKPTSPGTVPQGQKISSFAKERRQIAILFLVPTWLYSVLLLFFFSLYRWNWESCLMCPLFSPLSDTCRMRLISDVRCVILCILSAQRTSDRLSAGLCCDQI